MSDERANINGEIDFYINGNLRWGIELLVSGRGIGEHLSRFTAIGGKYAPLNVAAYVVVDFRGTSDGEPTSVHLDERRITVFFKLGCFRTCKVVVGSNPEAQEFALSN